MRIRTTVVAVAVSVTMLLGAGRLYAAEWHVSPDGKAEADGSAADPWSLAKAFAAPEAVKPGDTIWLHGGTYTGNFTCALMGTADKPIIVRQAPGERATIDTDSTGQIAIVVSGNYVWLWGFEIMSSDLNRVSKDATSWPADVKRGSGIDTGNSPKYGIGTRFINLVIHDTSGAFGVWREAVNPEIYGCIIYYNGWDGPDRGHGHGIYAQSGPEQSFKLLDNITFAQFSHGIHVYGSGNAYLNNFTIAGNISFNNGILSKVSGYTRDILVGGGRTAENPVVQDNYCYFAPSKMQAIGIDMQFGHGSKNAAVKDNYVACEGAMAFKLKSEGAAVSGNTFVGNVEGIKETEYPDNAYIGGKRPTGLNVFVRPNQYEPGRAHIAVFNWDNLDTVTADVSEVLKLGEAYEVRDVQNYFGPPVAAGAHDGKPIELPMNLTAVAEVIGTYHADFAHTPKEFGAFVLIGKGLATR